MFQSLYESLASIGYHHPVHPALTHLTVGMVIGAFIFGVLAWVTQKPGLTQTARGCVTLALISVAPVAIVGYGDWQQFFGGAWIAPVKWKLILAPALFVLLFIAWLSGRKSEKTSFGHVSIYFICLAIVTAIGYFGGELVYGEKKSVKANTASQLVAKGAEVFTQNCALCHYSDSEETKIGPGLKGIFQKEKLSVSQKMVTEKTVREQIVKPFANMPAFGELEKEELDALVAYLKSL